MAEAMLVIFVSLDGEEPWTVVPPNQVPEWLKDPDVMAELVAGSMAQNKEAPLAWYRAEELEIDHEVKH